MSLKRTLPIALAIAFGASPAAAEAQERMQPGAWQMETLMGGKPLPGGTRCIGPAEAATANGSAAEIKAAIEAVATGCRVGEVTAEGDRVTFEQTCDGSNQRGDFHYRGATMEGTMTISLPGRPTSVMSQKGRRIGACP